MPIEVGKNTEKLRPKMLNFGASKPEAGRGGTDPQGPPGSASEICQKYSVSHCPCFRHWRSTSLIKKSWICSSLDYEVDLESSSY